MTPLAALLLLAVTPATKPAPLPDGKSIDTFTFSIGGGSLPPTGHLTVTAAGTVTYRNQPELFTTSSGGSVKTAEWEIPKADAATLFEKLVADGLLDLPQRFVPTNETRFSLMSGKWKMYLVAHPIPEKIMAHLQPMLEKADAHRWKPRPVKKDDKPVVSSVAYTFTEKEGGHEILFSVSRHNTLGYFRKRPASDPNGASTVVSKVWGLKEGEAEKLIDALVADGILDLPEAGEQRFPSYHLQAFVGKWQTELRPKAMPEESLKRLRPLFEDADPEWWRKR